jgi:hypothetical protein
VEFPADRDDGSMVNVIWLSVPGPLLLDLVPLSDEQILGIVEHPVEQSPCPH